MATKSVGYVEGDHTRTFQSQGQTTSPKNTRTFQSVNPRHYRLKMSWDWEIRSATKSITSIVYDPGGTPVVGATVWLIRETDRQVVATTTTNNTGRYTFTRDSADPFTYWVLSYNASSPQKHGASDTGITPT